MITLQNLSNTPAAPAAANASAPVTDDTGAGMPGFASLLAGLRANAGNSPDTPGTALCDAEDEPTPAAPVIDTATGEVQAAISMVASFAAAPADKVAHPAPAVAADSPLRAVRWESEGAEPAVPLRAEPAATGGIGERTHARAVAPEAGFASHGVADDAASGTASNSAVAREPAALTDPVRLAEHPVQSPGTPAPQLAAFAQHYPTEMVSRPVSVDAPIGSARWGEQLATQVVFLVRDGTQAADIQVTPPELGPVRARISVEDGVATVILSTPAHATREALEAALPALRDVLAESGIQLGESAVSEERFGQQGEPDSGPMDRETALTSDSPGDAPGSIPPGRRLRVGLLDLYA